MLFVFLCSFHIPRFQHCLWYWQFAQSPWDLLPFARVRPMLTHSLPHILYGRRAVGIRWNGFEKVLTDEPRLADWYVSLGRSESDLVGSCEDDMWTSRRWTSKGWSAKHKGERGVRNEKDKEDRQRADGWIMRPAESCFELSYSEMM